MKTTDRLLSLALGCALVACQSDPGHDRGDPDPADDATGEPPGDSPAPGSATGPARSVTLLTGHRVTVRGDRAVTIDPPAGRSSAARSYHRVGHLYIVPAEVELLVERGKLDRRLFDVTELLAQGYGDDRRADLPIIVTYRAGAARADRAAALAAAGARSIRPLTSIGGAAMRAPKRDAAAIWSALAGTNAAALADGVDAVWLDRVHRPFLDVSAPQIGAPAAWAAGLTGQGVKVAVLDTGIKADHPDFAGRIVDARSFVDGLPEPVDEAGHGTHVASILAGSGAAEDGRYRGVAPDAQLLDGQVCDQFGCFESWIIAGMEWAAESGARVVNLSLGGADGPEIDPVEQAINQLTELHGTLFVAAAGNQGSCGGPDALRVSSPSTADAALSVGAVDRDDLIADFSCRGPRVGDGAVKPDLTAPGVAIAAARAPGTRAGDADPVNDFYARLSGTSMATPHVAGAAALLAQQHPDWRAAELKAALMASSRSTSGSGVFVEGAGRVDVAAAITTGLFTAPASLAMGQVAWPHDDDEPSASTLTYRNLGASPVTLELTLDVRDPSGAPAVPGLFTVEPATLTIPAGAEAQVTVTADTRPPSPDGIYGGVLLAATGARTVRTPVSLGKEPESYDLNVDVIDRQGDPVGAEVLLANIETGELLVAFSGETIRLPRATYLIDATLFGSDHTGLGYAAKLVQPRLELTGMTSITMDARLAEPISVSVPAPTARRALEVVDYVTPTGSGPIGSSVFVFDPDGSFGAIYTAQVGDAPPVELTTVVNGFWAEPGVDPDIPFLDSPFIYNISLVASESGFPTGFSRRIDASELARIDNEYAPGKSSSLGASIDLPTPPSDGLFFWGITTRFHLPARRTSHYLVEIPDWFVSFAEEGEDFAVDDELSRPDPILPPAGTRTRDRWNQAVVGPSLSFEVPIAPQIARIEDRIVLVIPSFFSDRSNHVSFWFGDTAASRLFRDGELIGESDGAVLTSFPVPAEAGNYRLEAQLVRGGGAALSTQLDLAWTFRSQSGDPRGLPILAARFLPNLDDSNRAPANTFFVIPVQISRQEQAPTPGVESLRIDASYDRGQTWQRALVVRVGDVAVALVQHPRRGGGTVSLRARATDRDGNTMDQTIRDAYHLR